MLLRKSSLLILKGRHPALKNPKSISVEFNKQVLIVTA